MKRYFYSSVTRVSDLSTSEFSVETPLRDDWATGDYVICEVVDTRGRINNLEIPNGRMIDVMEGDQVIGALGARAATLEAVGDWRAIISNELEALTPAGLFGRLTSISPFLSPLVRLQYLGHTVRNGQKVTMQSGLPPAPKIDFDIPIILIIGTSMSAGKTLSGRLIVHLLSRMGLRVTGAKLTGAARYRDVLSYKDAGASSVFDFVDAGLPSTVVEGDDFRRSLDYLLRIIAADKPDVVVAEAGASPLEPYNGEIAMEVLGDNVRFEVLCAQDPYSVLGVQSAFTRNPDLVAGGATNTTAGIDLVKKLTGLPAMNLLDRSSHAGLAAMLKDALGY